MTPGGEESSRSTAAGHAIAIALLSVLCAAIYSNALTGPFVYDDNPNIVDNEWPCQSLPYRYLIPAWFSN